MKEYYNTDEIKNRIEEYLTDIWMYCVLNLVRCFKILYTEDSRGGYYPPATQVEGQMFPTSGLTKKPLNCLEKPKQAAVIFLIFVYWFS